MSLTYCLLFEPEGSPSPLPPPCASSPHSVAIQLTRPPGPPKRSPSPRRHCQLQNDTFHPSRRRLHLLHRQPRSWCVFFSLSHLHRSCSLAHRRPSRRPLRSRDAQAPSWEPSAHHGRSRDRRRAVPCITGGATKRWSERCVPLSCRRLGLTSEQKTCYSSVVEARRLTSFIGRNGRRWFGVGS